ncbi:hypothetical protein DFH04_06595 [Clostridium novyi]|uniref:dsDNA nuclease domain-containing protein n=1 Tax=Clostridium novyi TaxID=1542 RepID=UPI000EA10B5E|nr:dsDNA nuclease domain-containing protein [Clostridium novyi]AYF54395.1 hypothetical protein DFH04_06595 [Clostridium novyi]
MDICDENYYKQIINIIEKHKKDNSAEATIKGFLYQFLVTLDKWIEMYRQKKFFEIYPEDCDDIKIKSENKIQYIQVKAYDSINFTLNHDRFIKSVENFWELYIYNNMKPNIQFIFHTNSKPGNKAYLMKRWIEGNLTNSEKEEIYLNIKEKLNKTIEQKFKEDKYKKTIKENIKNESLRFIDSIKLVFEETTVDNSKERLEHNILNNIKLINGCYKCKNIFYRLLIEVIEKSIKKNCKDKKLDNELLSSILHDSEENIIMKIEEKLDDMKNDINTMSNKHSAEHKEIKEEIKKIANKETHYIEEDTLNVIVSSRHQLGQKAYTLDLTEFFKYGEGYSCYKYIKSYNIWNNELLKKINVFFNNLIKEQNNQKHSILLDGIHYSIAFYIGYKYGKALRNPYLKRENEVYKFKSINTDNNYKIYDNKTLLKDTKDVVVIINTSRDSESIKDEVKDFINKSNINRFSIINLTLGERNDNGSVDKNNFYYIASQMAKLIQKYVNKDQTIHLFSITTVEEIFAIGRLLFDMKNIILYEHVGEEKIYMPTIRL